MRRQQPFNVQQFMLTKEQIDKILDKLVPVIAEPKDYGFMRGVLGLKLERMLSTDIAVFVNRLLQAQEKKEGD